MKATGGLAIVAVRQRKLDEAAGYIKALQDSDGRIQDPVTCERLGLAYASIARHAEAISYMEAALTADPTGIRSWEIRGKVIQYHYMSGDEAKAFDMFDATIAATPDKSEIAESLSHCAGNLVFKRRVSDVYALRDRYRDKLARRQDSIQLDLWCLCAEIGRGTDMDSVGKAAAFVAEAATLKADIGKGVCTIGQSQMYAGLAAKNSGSPDAAARMFAKADAIFQLVERQWPESDGAKMASLNSGLCALLAGDQATALNRLTAVAEKYPTWEESWAANFAALSCVGQMQKQGLMDETMVKSATADVVMRILRDNEDKPQLVQHAQATAGRLGIALAKGEVK